jgi:hypothetical protein
MHSSTRESSCEADIAVAITLKRQDLIVANAGSTAPRVKWEPGKLPAPEKGGNQKLFLH